MAYFPVVIPRIDVDPDIGDDRWRAAVEAAFAGCAVPLDCLYTTRVHLSEYLGGTATLYSAGVEGEYLVGGETPFGETPDELFQALGKRFAQGIEGRP